MSRRPQRRVVLRGAQQRSTQAVNLARGIGRRDFMRATGGFLAIAAFGSACSEDGGPGATGTVRVTITGLGTGLDSAGSATITGPGIGDPLMLTVPANSHQGEARVPVGTYSVVYLPPVGYAIEPGTSNARDVVVSQDAITEVNFAVVNANAMLRIVVAGIEAGTATGGSASVLRTDIAAQTPIVVSVPAAGAVTASFIPGTYSVTFSAPGGHQVGSAVENPQTVTLVAETTVTVNFAVEAVDAPAGVIFHSDWSTGLGATAAAFRDTGKADSWDFYGGGDGPVIATAASLGLVNWPTPNAYVVRRQTHQICADIGSPTAGSHRYFRYYLQVVYDDSHGEGSTGHIEHGVESADAASGGGDGMNFYRIPRNNGTWFPGFREISTGYRYVAGGLSLAKNQTYRLEWHLAYGASTYTVQVRIHDQEGAIVATDADFSRVLPAPASTDALLGAESFAYTAGDHRWFRVGCNGPSSNFPLGGDATDSLFIHGAVAISNADWCGPYGAGI